MLFRYRSHRVTVDEGTPVTLGLVALTLALAVLTWIVHPVAR
jgi:hypothetical protein